MGKTGSIRTKWSIPNFCAPSHRGQTELFKEIALDLYTVLQTRSTSKIQSCFCANLRFLLSSLLSFCVSTDIDDDDDGTNHHHHDGEG